MSRTMVSLLTAVSAVIAVMIPAHAAAHDPPPAGGEALAYAREVGIPPAEAARRLDRQALAPGFASAAENYLGTAFGGVWIDRESVLNVGVAGSMTAARTEAVGTAARAAGLDGGYRPVRVGYAMADLNRANALLADRLGPANEGASTSLTAGLRTDINAVELQLPAGATLTAAQDALISDAVKALGGLLVVGEYTGRAEARACVYPYCDPPLRGGIRIANSGAGCTGSFIARSKDDALLYQFTAGHCAVGNTDDWSTRFPDQSEHVIGPIHNSRFASNGDMAIMRVLNVTGWAPRGWLKVTDGPDTFADDTYNLSSDSTSVIGMRICTAGAFYGRGDCGTVTHLGVTASYNGRTVTNLGRGTFCGTGGDSGAPMYASHVAYGLQVAGYSECDSLYQGIAAAESAMNVNVLHALA
ncbi:protease [Actinorhabdospora filicis]|uniref:Protease n=1 Tax=Actinorhabdospora filicis TaxID=1785913 RepID=A0A9W6SNP6_9ACTN|nr:S1 family peptidase [Actinorhabdospora filicis]GLZ80230.1 protease [Actinorhabdospora filicis]